MKLTFDVVVIGAGVVGSAIARLLSRYACSVAVVEKECDVGMAASARNSGVIHAGINYEPGTLRARFCMEGRQLLTQLCEELNVPYSICGKQVVAMVPQAELYQYSTKLRSMTQGRGQFSFEFDHYEEVPRDVLDKLVAQLRKEQQEATA